MENRVRPAPTVIKSISSVVLQIDLYSEAFESCRNDYHQSAERILAEPGIEPVISCSQVRNATD